LCLAKREGFIAVMTEDAIWHQLQGNHFTTDERQLHFPNDDNYISPMTTPIAGIGSAATAIAWFAWSSR
jgi:hypothetical protein